MVDNDSKKFSLLLSMLDKVLTCIWP